MLCSRLIGRQPKKHFPRFFWGKIFSIHKKSYCMHIGLQRESICNITVVHSLWIIIILRNILWQILRIGDATRNNYILTKFAYIRQSEEEECVVKVVLLWSCLQKLLICVYGTYISVTTGYLSWMIVLPWFRRAAACCRAIEMQHVSKIKDLL